MVDLAIFKPRNVIDLLRLGVGNSMMSVVFPDFHHLVKEQVRPTILRQIVLFVG